MPKEATRLRGFFLAIWEQLNLQLTYFPELGLTFRLRGITSVAIF